MPENWDRLADEIQRLADIEAIEILKAKFVRLADAGEWDAWGKEVLAEDCFVHNDAGPLEGRERIIEKTSKGMANVMAIHYLHSPEITILGPDTASAIWPVNDYITGVFNGTSTVIRGYGHYHDDYVRTVDGWRLKRCRLVRQRVDTLTGAAALASVGAAGLRSEG